MKNKQKKDIAEKFRTVEKEIKYTISKSTSKLKLGLCVLVLSQDRFNKEYLSLDEIVESLDRLGVAVKPRNLSNAFSRAGNRVRCIDEDGVKKYKAMILGMKDVDDILSITGSQIVYVECDKPRTARKKARDIVVMMKGIIRICDPYYGVRTLDFLEMFSKKCNVRFLTAKTTEKSAKIKPAINDFKKEYPNVEIRVYPHGSDLHDRYIITNNCLLIIGHGLKDIGKKESFIIQIDSTLAPDLIRTIVKVFDQRWSNSSSI